MTLERAKVLSNFIYKRWLRLFPAMLICTALILLTGDVFSSRPSGEVSLLNALPGMLFIEPIWLEKLTGVTFTSLEMAFWSLYVEFKFYVIAAFLYFVLKDDKLTFILFGLFLVAIGAEFLNQVYDNQIVYAIYALSLHLSLSFFGWFAAGAAFYLFNKENAYKWLVCGLVMAILSSALLYWDNYKTMMSALVLSLFFTASFITPALQKLLQSRFLVFLGFVSYPLYLLHENMMISLVIDISQKFPNVPLIVPPIIALLYIITISFLICKYLEVPTKNYCKATSDKFLSIVESLRKR
jgi:peptidoglycan/LPS O-acetylase OafA/YrhL